MITIRKKNILDLLHFVKVNQHKQQAICDFLNKTDRRTIAVTDNNDLDFVKKQIRNRKVEIIPYSTLNKIDIKNKLLVFYSFNGQKGL